ncbi:MAG: hypothetical protein R3362_11700, partial [Rhodothermales bacterium]|nr:hypothetical protein [Rhodothermales bacterium]
MRLFLLVTLALLALPASAQTGEDVLRYAQREPAVGSRLSGMAGAAVGGVGAWGGVYANPAGLGLVRRSQVAGALSGIAVEEEAAYFGDTFDADAGAVALGTAAYVAKVPTLRGRLVFGIGYDQVAAYEREALFAGVNPRAEDLDGVGPLRQFGEVAEEGQRGRLTLAGAVEVAPAVLAGLAVNIEVGEYEFRQLLDEEYLDGGLAFQTDDLLSADLRGANLRGGLTAEVAPGVRLGAAVETPTILRVEEAFGLGSDAAGTDYFDYTITTPWRLAAGLAYANAGFLLTA